MPARANQSARPILATAFLYFAIIFALAFVTGAVRVLAITPRIGPFAAVLLEVPLLLAASWAVAGRLLRAQQLRAPQRLALGGLAFAMLMGCETLLATTIFGQTVGQWIAAIATPAGFVGLAGQLGFGAIPFFFRQTKSPPSH